MMIFATDGGVIGEVRMVLIAIAYLMIKHCVADFLLQTEAQRSTKGDYGALGGITHALTHVVLTAPVFLILPAADLGGVAALLTGEFSIHYHLDWAKEQVVRRNAWTSRDTPFWWALGIDQLGHGLTYVALVWLAIGLAAAPVGAGIVAP
jgi:Protein of unknown function (DUF3307)